MKKRVFGLLCLIFISPLVSALDLIEAYERAKATDPSWQANVLQYEADQLNLGIVKGNLLPIVTISGNVTYKNQELSDATVPGIPQINSDTLTSSSSTTQQVMVSARQPIFRWDVWEKLKQGKTSLNLSEITLKLQKQEHILTVAESYFNVLRQQSLTVAYLQEEKALLEQLNMMSAKLREGLVSKSDVSEANAQYQSVKANRIATHVQLILAQEQLSQIIGPYRENLAVLRDDFKFQKPIPEDLQAWLDLAQSQNLSIQQARIQYKYAEDGLRVEKAARYPKIEAVGSYGLLTQSPESVGSPNGQFDQVGIEMNWNVYNGGITKKNIKKAKVNLSKADALLDAALRKANTDVKKAYLQVETDQTKLEARKAALESSMSVSKSAQAQYDEGLKTMVDVLLAQRNTFSSKQDYLNSKYDYLVNVLRLKASVGQLTEIDINEMNAWLIKAE